MTKRNNKKMLAVFFFFGALLGAGVSALVARAIIDPSSWGSPLYVDSDLIPAESPFLDQHLGVSGQRWRSINGIVYTNDGGIKPFSIGADYDVSGVSLNIEGLLRLTTTDPRPACTATSSLRGTLWFVQAGTSTRDRAELCIENASGTLGWHTLIP